MSINIWVPAAFAPNGGDIYFIRGTHRGDMYHIRAIYLLSPRPILVYGSGENDLSAYLRESVNQEAARQKPAKTTFLGENFLLTGLEWTALTGATSPVEGYVRRSVKLISESEATTLIKGGVKGPTQVSTLMKGMAYIHPDDEKALKTVFDGLLPTLFPPRSGKTVLLQCRDTGTEGLGPYPELDSDAESIQYIAKCIVDNGVGMQQPMNVVLCGNKNDIGSLPSIKEYFKKLPSADHPRQSKRDIEAFFLEYAFSKGCFHAAVGFRSGALDLFTFLGIPTVSISLRDLVGEARHGQLAANTYLKRRNIQYEMPRHVSSKYFKGRSGEILVGSPWWNFDTIQQPSPTEKAQQKTPPTGFRKFDKEIIRIFLYKGIADVLSLRTTVFVKGLHARVQGPVFDVSSCRFATFSPAENIFFTSPPTPQAKDCIKGRKPLEDEDVKLRKSKLQETREPLDHFALFQKTMEEEWTKANDNLNGTIAKIPPPKSSGGGPPPGPPKSRGGGGPTPPPAPPKRDGSAPPAKSGNTKPPAKTGSSVPAPKPGSSAPKTGGKK